MQVYLKGVCKFRYHKNGRINFSSFNFSKVFAAELAGISGLILRQSRCLRLMKSAWGCASRSSLHKAKMRKGLTSVSPFLILKLVEHFSNIQKGRREFCKAGYFFFFFILYFLIYSGGIFSRKYFIPF